MSPPNPWDERFSAAGYVYGTAPNDWLAANADRLPPGARVLSPGEGEGRNAVFLARRGHAVTAVDGSAVGLEKARRLAASHGVALETILTDLAGFEPAAGAFDAVVLIYLHLPPALRVAVHARAAAALRPGGVLVLEAFTPRQLAHASGGPKDVTWLYEPTTLRADFAGVDWETLEEAVITLDESPLHRGPAAVVRGLGVRRR